MTPDVTQRAPAGAAALLLTAALSLPGTAAAQETDTIPMPDTTAAPDTVNVAPAPGVDTTANFTGTVASSQTGKPISGARVSIPEIQYGAITDEEGNFTIQELPPGLYDVRVHYLGYSTNQRPIRLQPGRVTNATFLLERDVLEVADLKVEVKQTNRVDPMADFKRRMERGFGDFITREEIEKRNPQHTSDLLRTVPGVDVGPVQYGQADVRMRRAGRECQPVVFLDGVLTRNYNIDQLQPQSIQAIEVYRRSSETPPQFTLSSSGCGVLVIHTRVGGTRNTQGG